MSKKKTPLKLGTSIILMVSAVIGSVLLVVYALLFFRITELTETHLKDKAFAIARTVANSPIVVDDLKGIGDPMLVQRFSEDVKSRNHLLFVIVTDMDGIRHSHPEPGQIGRHFIGDDLYPALLGLENTAVNRGVLD
ncbi:two-component system sensor histidine kinase DcuS, partial [Dickeya dadantii]|nr:two-component system sensor histidine kinase DcuS [Dickeya dadantii]NPE72756.1 two-component system sensor histidine kinase DcuS [Dickeya dadantii]